jgi:acyl-CoA dehydrogenase
MSDTSYLDWPFLEDRHRKLKVDLDSWCETQIFDHDGDVDDLCKSLVTRLGDAGILRNCVPAEWGGRSDKLDVRSLALCRESLGYHSGLADFSFAMQGLGSGPISLFGTDEQRKTYLPAVAAGSSIAAFALSEADAGSDVAAMATLAERDGDEFVINGEKTWISNGGIADFYCVFARTGEAPGARGLSAFIVDASNPGLSVIERIETIAPHPLATLSFDNCRVAASAMIGGGGDGFKVAMATLDVFRTTVAAAALGFARRALDEALEYTTRR